MPPSLTCKSWGGSLFGKSWRCGLDRSSPGGSIGWRGNILPLLMLAGAIMASIVELGKRLCWVLIGAILRWFPGSTTFR